MKIDCYLSEHCGSYHRLHENIDRALAESGLTAEVDEAVAQGVKGSPSIRVNGKDLFLVEGSASIA